MEAGLHRALSSYVMERFGRTRSARPYTHELLIPIVPLPLGNPRNLFDLQDAVPKDGNVEGAGHQATGGKKVVYVAAGHLGIRSSSSR